MLVVAVGLNRMSHGGCVCEEEPSSSENGIQAFIGTNCIMVIKKSKMKAC